MSLVMTHNADLEDRALTEEDRQMPASVTFPSENGMP